MRCVECLGPATIQVEHNGHPVSTYCQPCFDAVCVWGRQLAALLSCAYEGLISTPSSEVPATLRG